MIGGVNDAPAQADALARRLGSGSAPAAHVNLIPLNPTPGFGARPARPAGWRRSPSGSGPAG